MKDFNEIKVKMHLSIGIHNANKEDETYLSDWTDEDSWNEMSETEKEKFIEDCISDWAYNYIDIGGGIVE